MGWKRPRKERKDKGKPRGPAATPRVDANTPRHENERARAIIEAVFERYDEHVSVHPAFLAIEAMQRLDPERRAPADVYLFANLYLRQTARELCRGKFDGTEAVAEPHPELPNLQARYPVRTAPREEPRYTKLDHLTAADLDYNCDRLRLESKAKSQHADELETYREKKFGKRPNGHEAAAV